MNARTTPPAEKVVGRPSGRAIASVLSAALLFGTTGTALAQAPIGFSPLGAGALRLTIGGLGLLVVSRREVHQLHRAPVAIVTGGFFVAVYQLAFFWATRSTGVAIATIVTIASSPVASRIIGMTRRSPVPPTRWYVATSIVVGGLVLLILGGSESTQFSPIGVMAAALAGSGFAAYTEAGSVAMVHGVPSTVTMAGLFGAGAVFSWFVLPWQPLGWATTQRGVLVLAYLGLVTLTLAYIAFGRGLAHLTPSLVVVLTILEPVVASILAVTFLDERLNLFGWAGAAVVLVGLIVASRGDRTR